MNNEYSYVSDMQEKCKLYGMVEVDQLRPVWKARKFAIQVPDSIVQSGLLPSIFDWQLLNQVMPGEQAIGEVLLQQRINDLELLNSLTTSLQRIQILPELGIDVDVIMGRPSYNVIVQDDGSILVKELPSLHIRVCGAESRAAAGQDVDILDEPNRMALEQRKYLADLVDQKESLFGEPGQQEDASNSDQRSQVEPVESTDEPTEMAHEDTNEELVEFKEFLEHNSKSDQPTKLSELDEDEDETPLPTEPANQMIQEPAETRIRRRQPFWIRFGNWLRQSLPRLNQ